MGHVWSRLEFPRIVPKKRSEAGGGLGAADLPRPPAGAFLRGIIDSVLLAEFTDQLLPLIVEPGV